jgi:hypothetical protein
MTSVLLSLGDWMRQQQRNDLAEAFFRKAADLDPPRVEVRAVERLADLYVGLDRVDQVDRVLNEYGDRLFSEKTQLYAKDAPPEQIYEFHRTLGELYGYLASTGQREWGNRNDPRSASFQLQHAYDKWKEIEAPTKAALDPAVAELLARSYQAESNPAKAAAVRIDAAERLDAKGDARGRDVLIREIDKTTLPVEQKQRFEVLEAKPPAVYSNALTDVSKVPSRTDASTITLERVDNSTVASPKTDYVRKAEVKETSIARSSRMALPDIRRDLKSSRSVLTLFTSTIATGLPQAAAEELATSLATWLERDTSKAARAAQRSRSLPVQVKSWDGSSGIALLEVDGHQVEILFQLAPAGP